MDKCSLVTRKRLETQGYHGFSDQELAIHRFGIRFAYGLCTTLIIIGLILANIPVLIIAMLVAFFGIFPPYHPFDYLYNYLVRHLIKKPKLPPRSNQGRFACGIASVWIASIIYFFYIGLNLWAYILGVVLLIIAILVTTTDFCIPSIIYNFLFKKRKINN